MEGRGQSNLEMSRVPEEAECGAQIVKNSRWLFKGGRGWAGGRGRQCVTRTELWLYKVKKAVGTAAWQASVFFFLFLFSF